MTTQTTTLLAALALSLWAACSSNGSNTSNTTSAPIGATPTTNTGLVGCDPLEQGCYSFKGDYKAPAVTTSCSAPGGPATGAADTHCNGVTPQQTLAASCSVGDAGAGTADAGPTPTGGACGENGPDYGTTMYGTEADDDDCKYHVSYSVSPLCENDGTYFVVTANYLGGSKGPLVGACTFAELCLNDTHAIPEADYRPPGGKQVVVEGPPGTYTIGPVEFDQAGKWTVRFHFNELCCDVAASSPHGHAAFFVEVP